MYNYCRRTWDCLFLTLLSIASEWRTAFLYFFSRVCSLATQFFVLGDERFLLSLCTFSLINHHQAWSRMCLRVNLVPWWWTFYFLANFSRLLFRLSLFSLRAGTRFQTVVKRFLLFLMIIRLFGSGDSRIYVLYELLAWNAMSRRFAACTLQDAPLGCLRRIGINRSSGISSLQTELQSFYYLTINLSYWTWGWARRCNGDLSI